MSTVDLKFLLPTERILLSPDVSSILALALHCHSVFDISHFFIIVLDPFVPLSTIMIQNVSFFSGYDVFIYIFCQIFVDLVPFSSAVNRQ